MSTQMDYFRKLRRKNTMDLGNRCAICGKTRHLHIHHVSYPFGKPSGGKNRVFNIQKMIENGFKKDLVLLCDAHHKMVRENMIKPQKTVIKARKSNIKILHILFGK